MSLSEDVWQALKGYIPRRQHESAARDIVQLFEDAEAAEPIYGRGTLYEAAGMDDRTEEYDDEEDEL